MPRSSHQSPQQFSISVVQQNSILVVVVSMGTYSQAYPTKLPENKGDWSSACIPDTVSKDSPNPSPSNLSSTPINPTLGTSRYHGISDQRLRVYSNPIIHSRISFSMIIAYQHNSPYMKCIPTYPLKTQALLTPH
jgi:hypothetical protein